MKIMIRVVAGLLVLAQIGCSSKPTKPTTPTIQAPWAPYVSASFDGIFREHLRAEIAHQKQSAVDLYISSNDDLYKEYSVAKEVGHKDRLMSVRLRAYDEIVGSERERDGEHLMMDAVKLEFGGYNNDLQGFPMWARPKSNGWGFVATYHNRNYPSIYPKESRLGLKVQATDKGVHKAEVVFDQRGWVLPASVEEAYRLLRPISETEQKYLDVWSVLVYGIKDCKIMEEKRFGVVTEKSLRCRGMIKEAYAYLSKDKIRRDVQPWRVMKKVEPIIWCEKVYAEAAAPCKAKQ